MPCCATICLCELDHIFSILPIIVLAVTDVTEVKRKNCLLQYGALGGENWINQMGEMPGPEMGSQRLLQTPCFYFSLFFIIL